MAKHQAGSGVEKSLARAGEALAVRDGCLKAGAMVTSALLKAELPHSPLLWGQVTLREHMGKVGGSRKQECLP